jgi:hypothetical protein
MGLKNTEECDYFIFRMKSGSKYLCVNMSSTELINCISLKYESYFHVL